MTNASAHTEPAGPCEIESPVSQRALVARRRRIFVLVLMAVVVAIAIAANHGPLQSYLDARARLEKAAAKVAALEAQKAELQSRLGKLTEAEYLETLAREELTYARSGEDVYIITGVPESQQATEPGAAGETVSESAAAGGTVLESAAAGAEKAPAEPGPAGPGPLERLLLRFLDLF